MSTKVIITRGFLERYEACEEDTDLFCELFPQGAEVTWENLCRAADAGIDLGWLVNKCRICRSDYSNLAEACDAVMHQRSRTGLLYREVEDRRSAFGTRLSLANGKDYENTLVRLLEAVRKYREDIQEYDNACIEAIMDNLDRVWAAVTEYEMTSTEKGDGA